MVEQLTSWALRKRAAERGCQVSGEQFKAFLACGLLPVSSDERWPVETVERLVRICQLGETVRSLTRRLLLLRREPAFSEVPADKLREAMLDVAPKIETPARKMRRVDVAVRWWASIGQTIAKASPLPSAWRPPTYKVWQEVLLSADDTAFAERVSWQYYAAGLLRDLTRGTKYDLTDLPVEELVTLLTIRDLAALRDQREHYLREQSRSIDS